MSQQEKAIEKPVQMKEEDLSINKDIEDELIGEDLSKCLDIEEIPEKLILNSVYSMVNEYRDYIKISRFKSDIEYENIKD